MRKFGHLAFNGVAVASRRNSNRLAQAFSRVVGRGIFLRGTETRFLEKKLRSYLPGGSVTTLASGHDALLLSILSLHLSAADEVLFPVNAYPTAFPIALSGVKPVPVDVDSNGQMDLTAAKRAITPKTRAMVVVHLYGLVGNLEGLKKLCEKHHLTLIEDAAQAFGTQYNQKPVGTLGDIGCFSFYPTKNLGALGDGGAVWTKHKKVFTTICLASSYGEKERYKSLFISGHSQLPELQAAGLTVYFATFTKEVALRKSVASWYSEALRDLSPFLSPLRSHPHGDPVHHLFVINAQKRNTLRSFLARRGIPTMIHYPQTVHRVDAFKYLGYKRGDFPMAERLASHIMSLPFHPYMSREQILFVASSIRAFYETRAS